MRLRQFLLGIGIGFGVYLLLNGSRILGFFITVLGLIIFALFANKKGTRKATHKVIRLEPELEAIIRSLAQTDKAAAAKRLSEMTGADSKTARAYVDKLI